MKYLAIFLLAAGILGGTYAAGDHAGASACTAKNDNNTLAAVKQQRTQAAIQATRDNAAAAKVASHDTQTHHTETTLQETIDAPQPAPAASTRAVPNPFPAGFSVCWNAASTYDAAAVAACQARRGDAAMRPGTQPHGG